ncbi:MAG: hypothetical protein IH859_04895 [Chloroflexi bacterium]|nr:hypothetical protein [Chloroflexota bacterium]
MHFPLYEITQAMLEQKQSLFASPDSVAVHNAIYRSIAAGEPVTPEYVAEATGIPVEDIAPAFDDLRKGGSDFNAEGELAGFMLSLVPTQHEFKLNGRDLYTWCAFDALFLPGFLGETAHVQSICRATGETIQLIVTPQGIENPHPAEAALSLTVPGISAACAPGQKGGAAGASCSSIDFFINRIVAEEWLGADTDLAILSLDEAWHVAYEARIKPYQHTLAKLT